MKYDVINILQIWNSVRKNLSDYRDVIFNENEFYDIHMIVNVLEENKKTFVFYSRNKLFIMNDNDNEH